MPDVTLAPVLIDLSAQESDQSQFGAASFQGPFKIGTKLYCVLWGQGGTLTFNVFKSTDGGKAWTQKDAAHSPVYDESLGLCRMQARLNADGTTLTIGFNPTGPHSSTPSTVSFVTFDTNTDTFTAGVIPDVTVADNGAGDFDFAVRSNGDIVLVYAAIVSPNVTQAGLEVVVMTAGAWGAPATLAPGSDGSGVQYTHPAIVCDLLTNTTHCFFRFQNATDIRDSYAQIDAANVVSGLQDLHDYGTRSVTGVNQGYGAPLIFSGSIYLAVWPAPSAAPTPSVSVAVYQIPLTDIPAFVYTVLETYAYPAGIGFQSLAQVMVDSGTVEVAWVYNPGAGNTWQIHRSINVGSGWQPVAVFYDFNANPPNATPIADTGIFALSIGRRGSVGAIITATDAADSTSVAYFLLGAAVPSGPVTLCFKGFKVYGDTQV